MKKIVTVGGGTGSYTILVGLKNINNIHITSIVSMADDGGSTGVLRDELGVLPPGDVRQCLTALSSHTDIVRKLMSYRFSEGNLSGHSFGNIFLAALEKVTGNFGEGVEIASDILKVKGKVIPVTYDNAKLLMILNDGRKVFGENSINEVKISNKEIIGLTYENQVKISNHAKEAIENSDFIIFGPGNYYCSVLPNVIVSGFVEVLKFSKAKIIFPVNLTNKSGHSLHFSVSDYVKNLEKYLDKKIDYVLINNEFPSEEQVDLYELKEGDGVLPLDDYEGDNAIRVPLLSNNIFKEEKGDSISHTRSFIRHDSVKLANALNDIFKK